MIYGESTLADRFKLFSEDSQLNFFSGSIFNENCNDDLLISSEKNEFLKMLRESGTNQLII